jgi:hypothetical protein
VTLRVRALLAILLSAMGLAVAQTSGLIAVNLSGQSMALESAKTSSITKSLVLMGGMSTQATPAVAYTGPVNVVAVGDSITVGSGASIEPPQANAPLGDTTTTITYGTDWIDRLRQVGYFSGGNIAWRLGQGSQKIADGLSQYTHSQGVNVSASLMNGSTSATLSSIGEQLIQPGTVVTGEGIPDNTTGTFAAVEATCSWVANGNALTTLTVVGPTTGIVNGMFIVSETFGAGGSPGDADCYAGNTITISGNTITLALGGAAYGGGLYTGRFYFVSPHVTLSNAFTGTTTGSQNLNFGGTLVTSSGNFTSGSPFVTGVTTTGSSVGLISNMGIGSMYTAPGTTFTISGSTLTLSSPATASSVGAGTFCASCPTFNTASPQNTYLEGLNTTPHLLSPAVTGVPGTLLLFYGVNDAGNGGDLSGFEANYLAYGALARADGYTVVFMTQVPLTSTAAFNYGMHTALQDSMNAWTRTQAYPGVSSGYDYLIDIATQFPAGHPATDIYHISDGIHPDDLGHQMIADCVATQYLQQIEPSANVYSFWTSVEGLSGATAQQSTVLESDGLTNLLKYACGLNPALNYSSGATGVPSVQVQNSSGTGYLTLTFNGVATDVTYTVQATNDPSLPSNLWTTVYTFPSGGATPPGMVTVQDTQAITATTSRYMRLQVTSP